MKKKAAMDAVREFCSDSTQPFTSEDVRQWLLANRASEIYPSTLSMCLRRLFEKQYLALVRSPERGEYGVYVRNPFATNEPKGWLCPKCGRVYAPGYPSCDKCGKRVSKMGDKITPDEAINECLKLGAQGISLGLAKQLQADRDQWKHHAESRSLAMEALTKARDRAQEERDALAVQNAEMRDIFRQIKGETKNRCNGCGESRGGELADICDSCGAMLRIEELSTTEFPIPQSAEWVRWARDLAEKVKGFRDHGEAKNGTHATILFDLLAKEPK